MAKENNDEKRVDRALRGFVDQLVARMEEASEDMTWKKPWIVGKSHYVGLPQNIKGNVYTGGQALLLQLHTMEKGFSMPIYMTYNQAKDLDLNINKGAKSTDVFKWGLRVFDKETHKRIPEDMYREMTKEEQEKYDVRPYLRSFVEFNIDQTNFKEVHPERYEALLRKFHVEDDKLVRDTTGMYDNEALNRLIHEDGQWICPIIEEKGAQAAYSPGANRIEIPLKSDFNIHPGDAEETFKDGEAYYSTALHEMAHSTGHASYLARPGVVNVDHFGSSQYAKEELVAELTAATVSNALGFDKRITENSAAYLKGWAASLKKDPRYIVSVMSEVNKAALIELEHIDEQRKALGEKPLLEGNLDGVEEKRHNQEDMEAAVSAALETGKKEAQLLGLFGLPVQDTYYNKVDLTKENDDGTVRDLYDRTALYNLYVDGVNDKIVERLVEARLRFNLTLDNTLPGSFKYELPDYERIGEDGKYVYMVSSDADEGFVMMEKVSKDDLLHKHLPQHLDPDHLNAIGYDEKTIEDIMALAGELGLFLANPEKKLSGTEDVAETFEDEKNIKDNPKKEVYYAGADIIDKRLAGSFQAYRENGDTASMLGEARSWMQQNHTTVEQYMVMDPSEVATENIIAEDEKLVIVDGKSSYDIFPKLTKEEILADIKKNGVDSDATHVVRDIAYEDVARQFAEKKRDPYLEMPSGDLLTLWYNKETNTLDVGPGTDASIVVRNAFPYHNGQNLDENLGIVTEELRELPYYRKTEELSEDKEKRRAVFKEIISQPSHTMTMPNGEKLDYAYEMEFNTVSFAIASDGVTHVIQSYDYDLGKDVKANLADFQRDLSSISEFKEQVTSTADVTNASNENVSQINNNNDMDEKKVEQPVSEVADSVVAQNVARDRVQEEFRAFGDNTVEMNNGEVLTIRYNHDDNKLVAGVFTEAGYVPRHERDYDLTTSLEGNLWNFTAELANMPDYQGELKSQEGKKAEIFYSLINDMSQSDSMKAKELNESGDKEGLLALATEYIEGDDLINQHDMTRELAGDIGLEVSAEDDNKAILYDDQSNEYRIYRKVTASEILDDIKEHGLASDASPAVKSIAYEDIARQFAEMGSDYSLEMPNGDAVYLQYNKETNKMEVGFPGKNGFIVDHDFDYNTSLSMKENIDIVHEECSKMPQYQETEDTSEEKEITATAEKTASQTQTDPRDEKRFYNSFAFMQMQEDTEQFEKLRQEGKYDEMLFLASEHVQDSDIDLEYIKENARSYQGDDLVAENEELAIVYNGAVGGTYDLMKKVSENEIREKIEREGGLDYNHKPDYPKTVWDIQRDMVQEEWDNTTDKTIKMPSGEVLGLSYNRDKDTIEIRDPRKQEEPIQTILYDYERRVAKNIGSAKNEMSDWPEYQKQKEQSVNESEDNNIDMEKEKERSNELLASEKKDMEGKFYFAIFNGDRDTTEAQVAKFTELREKGDVKGLLDYAREQSQEYPLEQAHVNRYLIDNDQTALPETILASDKEYVVTVAEDDEDLYNVYRKVTKEEIIRDLEKNGLAEDASHFVDKVYEEQKELKSIGLLKDYVSSLKDPNDALSGDYSKLPKDSQAYSAWQENEKLVKEYVNFMRDPSKYDLQSRSELFAKMGAVGPALNTAVKAEVERYKRLAPAHEDSNIQTNVVADAKKIADSGIPMEKAEKIAKAMASDMAHEDMHHKEQEDHEKDDKEQKQREQAKKEEQKKQEAEKKKEEQKKETPHMALSHSALLLAALAAAKENEGVWMNGGYRSNASFLDSKKSITTYNNIMMNLAAEQQGFKTNVYTNFDLAKQNGMPVLESQKSLPFSWTNWKYVNKSNEADVLSSKQYHALPKAEQANYVSHAQRVSLPVFNIDQTTLPASDYAAYKEILKKESDRSETLKMDKETNLFRTYSEVSKKHPDSVVLMRDGDSYKSYNASARKVAKALGLPMGKGEYQGKEVDFIEFNFTRLDDYLPRIIRDKNRVAICDRLQDPKYIKDVADSGKILSDAYGLAKSVAKTDGMKYERVMVVQDAKYDRASNTFSVSGMSAEGKDTRTAAIEKATDIYRKLVMVTGLSDRLDRGGRNHLTPIDDVKYDKLVQELGAGVLMARQGLPATLSKEGQELIPYWQMEIKENPRMMGIIERDVNTAVEVIDNLSQGVKPNYMKILGTMPEKVAQNKSDYSVIKNINKLPDIDSKRFVIIKDEKSASVILPKGASLKVDNEVSGMRKERILTVLRKEGVESENVKFYNAGGSLGLKQKNDFFAGKTVSLVRLNQWQFEKLQDVKVSSFLPKKEAKTLAFTVLKNDDGKYFFHIKPSGEKGFCVDPEKKFVNSYFSTVRTGDPKGIAAMKKALSQQFYKLASEHDDMKKDFITPRKIDVDYNRIQRVYVASSKKDPNVKLVSAMIDGERQVATITDSQWKKMWLAEDMNAYKLGVAAVAFENILTQGKSQEANLDLNQEQSESVGQEVKNEEQDDVDVGRGKKIISPTPEPESTRGVRM